MHTEMRDRELAAAVDEIAAGIRWPDPSFTLNPWETAVGLVIAFYEAVTTPNRVIVRFALNGLAL